MPFNIEQLAHITRGCGVYIMRDVAGHVLYIGKAKNIQSRLRQYFLLTDERAMVPHLLEQIETIDTLIVETEKEALIVENNLIKEHKPKFNVCLKDDKSFFSIMINHKHKWPMLRVVRYKGKPPEEGLYFGPYTKGQAAKETLELLRKLFPLRQCSDRELISRSRPCILYDMKRCIAPCVGRCSSEDYHLLVKQVIHFLRGQDSVILKELKRQMQEASDHLEFEKAEAIFRTIENIEATLERQKVQKVARKDLDIIGLAREGERAAIAVLFFRQGRLAGSNDYYFDKTVQEDDELISSFIVQNYADKTRYPHEILTPVTMEDGPLLSSLLSDRSGHLVTVLQPKIGEKKGLIEMAIQNARAQLVRQSTSDTKEATLMALEEQLHLLNYPEIIECIDNSNLSGTEAVSALVVFWRGLKSRARYRKYTLRAAGAFDDYSALTEVLTRRFSRAQKEGQLPDLLLIDGGRGHLNIAIEVLARLDISTVDVIAISKEEAKHTKSMTLEKIHHPEWDEPLVLKPHSNVLHLLQQIRDEAHRFALTFQKTRRSKKSFKSVLDDLPGIGPIKRKRLLKTFGSVKRILEASEAELLKVPGIGQKDVIVLKECYNREKGQK